MFATFKVLTITFIVTRCPQTEAKEFKKTLYLGKQTKTQTKDEIESVMNLLKLQNSTPIPPSTFVHKRFIL